MALLKHAESVGAPAAAKRIPGKRGRPGYDQAGVLNRAVDVFNVHGYDSTTMGMLADALGISKSAIYHHVESKEELLALALDVAISGLESVLEEAKSGIGTPRDQLEHIIRATVHVLVERQPFVTLLLRLRGNSSVEIAALERRREFDTRMREIVTDARDGGFLRREVDPATTARLIFGTINSVLEWYQPAGRLSAEELADDVVLMIFSGLAGEKCP